MKNRGKLRWVSCMIGVGLGATALAQETGGTQEQTQQREGKELTIEQQTRTLTQTQNQYQDATPEGADRQTLSDPLREHVRDFQGALEEWRIRAREIQEAREGLTEEDRERIRALVRLEFRDWLEQVKQKQNQLKETIQERVRSQKKLLQEGAQEEMRERYREKVQEQKQEGKERRVGVD